METNRHLVIVPIPTQQKHYSGGLFMVNSINRGKNFVTELWHWPTDTEEKNNI